VIHAPLGALAVCSDGTRWLAGELFASILALTHHALLTFVLYSSRTPPRLALAAAIAGFILSRSPDPCRRASPLAR